MMDSSVMNLCDSDDESFSLCLSSSEAWTPKREQNCQRERKRNYKGGSSTKTRRPLEENFSNAVSNLNITSNESISEKSFPASDPIMKAKEMTDLVGTTSKECKVCKKQ
ncbi:hypothetical protein SK128_017856, partial [Halocaridina rubra]